MFPAAVAVVHRAAGPDGRDLGRRQDGGAGFAGGALELARDRPHAADGNIPVTGSAAQEVVQEADVLLEVGAVRPGESPDQGIRQDHAAHQVAVQPAGNGCRQSGCSISDSHTAPAPAAVASCLASAG